MPDVAAISAYVGLTSREFPFLCTPRFESRHLRHAVGLCMTFPRPGVAINIMPQLRHYLPPPRFEVPLVLNRARRLWTGPPLCAASSPAFLPPPLPPFVQ